VSVCERGGVLGDVRYNRCALVSESGLYEWPPMRGG
jgi:hypothetical protein